MAKRRKKLVKYAIPSKIESILIGMLFLLLFLFDILQNKFQDLGLDYEVTVFSGLTFTAITGFWIALIIYLFIFFALIIRSAWDRATHPNIDYFIGIITLFGLFMIVTGAIGGIYFGTNEGITWLFNLKQINLYHIGVALQVIGALYFLVTK